MRKLAIALAVLALLAAVCACEAEQGSVKHDPTIEDVTAEASEPVSTPRAESPAPSAEPLPTATPNPEASANPRPSPDIEVIVLEPETNLPYIAEDIPSFLEVSNELIEYGQGKSTITLPVANTSNLTAKGALLFDIYESNGIVPKWTLKVKIEEREEMLIFPGETVTLVATADTDLRDCWIRVRVDPDNPMVLFD